MSNVQVIWVPLTTVILVPVTFDCPDVASTIVAPLTKPVPARFVILTALLLNPLDGEMLAMVGALVWNV
jgi:hypothetical protein